MPEDLTISQLVEQTGLSEGIIRSYVTQKLISPKRLSPEEKGQPLLFDPNTSDRAIAIRALWEIGFAIEEIRRILEKILDLHFLREKIAILPYPKLTQLLRSQGVNLFKRPCLRRLLNKIDPVLCTS